MNEGEGPDQQTERSSPPPPDAAPASPAEPGDPGPIEPVPLIHAEPARFRAPYLLTGQTFDGLGGARAPSWPFRGRSVWAKVMHHARAARFSRPFVSRLVR